MAQKFVLSENGIIKEATPNGIANTGQIYSIIILGNNGDVFQITPAQLQSLLGSSEIITNLVVTGTTDLQGNVSIEGTTTLALPVINSSDLAIIAAGTSSQANSYGITKSINYIKTCAATTNGVRLPVATVGYSIIIRNNGANTCLVYPATSGTIDGGSTNAAITIQVGQTITFFASTTTNWVSNVTPTSNVVKTNTVLENTVGQGVTIQTSIGNITLLPDGSWTIPTGATFTKGGFNQDTITATDPNMQALAANVAAIIRLLLAKGIMTA